MRWMGCGPGWCGRCVEQPLQTGWGVHMGNGKVGACGEGASVSDALCDMGIHTAWCR